MTYENSIAKHNEAQKAFHSVRNDYRNRIVGDAEFLAAKAVYDASTAEYDAAFAAAQEA
jgi:hypothetical protein